MVKRTFLGTSILGRGNYTGFRIWDSRYNLMVETKDYKMFPIATIVAILIMFLSPIFFAYFFGSGSIIKSILIFCFSSAVVICVLPWICRNIIYGKNYEHGLEWHAAEHMICGLLESTGDPRKITLTNLKRIPMFSSGCGNNNLFLAEPSEDKIEEALRIGRILNKKLEKHNEIADFFGLL